MIRTAQECIESIRDGRLGHINGERVADVPTHPMFKPLVDIRARIHDLRHEARTWSVMTFAEDGEVHAVGNKLPFTQQDRWDKRRATDTVPEEIGGIVTRVGDETVGEMWSLVDGQDVLDEVDHRPRQAAGNAGKAVPARGLPRGHQRPPHGRHRPGRAQPHRADGMPNQSLLATGRVLACSQVYEMMHIARELCGGQICVSPDVPCFAAPETRPWMDKFCTINEDGAAEDRRKLLAFARDLLNADDAGLSDRVMGATMRAPGDRAVSQWFSGRAAPDQAPVAAE